MTDDSLIQALPELVAFVRRDGTVVRELGGRRLGLTIDGGLVGKTDLADAAELIGQGPDKLAISLGRLASAMGIEPIVLDADPATAVRQLGMKLKERRAQLAKQTKADLMG